MKPAVRLAQWSQTAYRIPVLKTSPRPESWVMWTAVVVVIACTGVRSQQSRQDCLWGIPLKHVYATLPFEHLWLEGIEPEAVLVSEVLSLQCC